jgi:hypothetical protein
VDTVTDWLHQLDQKIDGLEATVTDHLRRDAAQRYLFFYIGLVTGITLTALDFSDPPWHIFFSAIGFWLLIAWSLRK